LWRCRPSCCGVHGRIADGRGCRQDGRRAPSAVSRTATDGGRAHGRATDEVRGGHCAGLTSGAELSVHVPGSGCCPGVFLGGGRGKGGALMAGAAVRESATFAGRPDQVREARVFVFRLLGPSHPCVNVAVLLASEMVTNSLRHGSSGRPGEAVTVTVVVWDAGVRVEVTGRKADSVPVLRPADEEAEGGRGLRLVEDLAVRWGYERGGGQAMTWFELRA
jgi:anti-sigma regulatory factor (Ser/Thr protein kinase)